MVSSLTTNHHHATHMYISYMCTIYYYFSLHYVEKPTAQITATTISFASSEDVTIVCAGSGGYPRFYNVSIWKNGVVLKQSTSASVEHNTADTPSGVSKYGDYTCYVNNMLLDDQVTLRIANEGIGNIRTCTFVTLS